MIDKSGGVSHLVIVPRKNYLTDFRLLLFCECDIDYCGHGVSPITSEGTIRSRVIFKIFCQRVSIEAFSKISFISSFVVLRLVMNVISASDPVIIGDMERNPIKFLVKCWDCFCYRNGGSCC